MRHRVSTTPRQRTTGLAIVLTLALFASGLLPASVALSQDAAAQAAQQQGDLRQPDSGDDSLASKLGDLIVIGTRVRGVAPQNLSVPVDLYDIEEMTASGGADLAVALQQVAPSFNSQRNAIERIEVLRHGAVSQYGADAVGGVINIVLKQDARRSTAGVQTGLPAKGTASATGLRPTSGCRSARPAA